MTRYLRAIGSVLVAALLAACSGSGTTPSSQTVPTTPQHKVKLGKLSLKMAVPSKKQMASHFKHLAHVYAGKNGGSQPAFVGAATTEIDFTLTGCGGCTTNLSQYDQAFYTRPSSGMNRACSSAWNGALECTIVFTAPSATDTYNVTAKWCNNPNADGSCTVSGSTTLTLISEGNFTVTVPAGGVGNAQLTLDPVVGKLSWEQQFCKTACFANGTAAPALSNGSYTCGSSGGCYDPLLNDAGTATYQAITLVAEDADGDTIVPGFTDSGSSSSSTPNDVPVYLTAGGQLDKISIACTAGSSADADVQLLKYSAPNPAPSPVAQTNLANGFTGATYTAINTPQRGKDGTAITDSIVGSVTLAGNDVAAINFDGGKTSYTTGSLDTCTATDSSSPAITAAYNLGFAFGSVAVIDQRHAPRH